MAEVPLSGEKVGGPALTPWGEKLPGDNRVQVTLHIPRDLLDRLDREARKRILHRGVVMRLVLEQWLDEQDADRA